MLRIHTVRRRGEMHVNTKKTSQRFFGLSRLSALRLREVLVKEAVVQHTPG